MTIGRIKRGNIIKASFLNEVVDDVNDLTREFADRPKQVLDASPGEVQNEAAKEDDDIVDPNSYIEIGRETSSIQVYDQNDENYAEVTRIEIVTLQNGNGETLTLQFNNET